LAPLRVQQIPFPIGRLQWQKTSMKNPDPILVLIEMISLAIIEMWKISGTGVANTDIC
jgi:hypothetical protein